MDYLKKLFNSIFWSDIESLEFDEDAITIMNNSRFTLFVTKVSNKSDVFTFIKKLSKNLNCEEICADNKQNVVDSIKREKRLIVTNVDSNELRDLLHVTNELSCLTFVIVEKSRGRFEFSSSLNPVYMAWFWSDSCENKLRALGECCRKSMLCDNVILSELERCIDKNDHGRNLEKYYNDQKNRLHVTARFLGNSGPENLDSAIRQFGSVAKVKMAGFLITPRTFSGYCLLPNNARKLFFDQINFSMTSDIPCDNGWYYSKVSGKCYRFLNYLSKSDALQSCRSNFSFAANSNQISLVKIQNSNDVSAISEVMKIQSNMADIWLDATLIGTRSYQWSDNTTVNNNALNSVTSVVGNLDGPCLKFRYSYENVNGKFQITYSILNSGCADKLWVTCEHEAKKCDRSSIPGFDDISMLVNPDLPHIQIRSHVACKFGYYRLSEINGIPQASDDANDIPLNYINCTGEQDATLNPFNFKEKWGFNVNQRFVESCKKISCSPMNGTLLNVQDSKTFSSSDANPATFDFGYQYKVMCTKGYVNFESPLDTNSSMKCVQSPADKRHGIWSPNNYTPCNPVPCNSSQIVEFEPRKGKLYKARNRVTYREYDVNFQRSILAYFDNILTVRCDDGYFFSDRSWEKQIVCGLKKDSLTEGEWNGYLGTTLPLDKSCQQVTCKYEEVLINKGSNLLPYWLEMNSNGVYINKTQHSGEPYSYQTKLRFFCISDFDTANQTPDQNLTCGPQGSWIPHLTTCIKKTDKLNIGNKKRYVPPAVEAPAAQEVGYVAIVIMVIFLSLIVILDMSTLARDVKIMKMNVKQLNKICRKKKNEDNIN